MGGSRFNRKSYSDDEINDLLEKYLNSENKLKSLFSDNTLACYKNWTYDLARNMDRQAKAKLQHNIHISELTVPNCNYCDTTLSLLDFLEGSDSYKKYCHTCLAKGVWRSNLSEEKLKHRGHNITVAKLNWYQTEKGKEVAKRVGKINSEKMREFNKTEKGKANIDRSRINNRRVMIAKIASGEFTPPVTNSYTHWTAELDVDGRTLKFRSSWEACVFLTNKKWMYEKIRIPYQSKDGVTRTYIADFFDSDTNSLYEIKPKSQWRKQDHKLQQIINYCITNNINFIWINEYNIMHYVNESLFSTPKNLKQLEKLKKGLLK